MEDALISLKGLAILTGAGLIHAGQKKDSNTNYQISAHTTAQAVAYKDTKDSNKIKVKFPNVPFGIDEKKNFYIMKLDSNGEMSGVPVKIEKIAGTVTKGWAYDPTNKEITITADEILENDVIFIDFYQLYTEDAVQIDITPDKFGGYFYLEGSTLFKRELDGVDLPAEIIIPKVKVQSNFTFTLASSGDPSTFTFTMDAFPDYTEDDKTKKVLASIQVLNADDNYDGGEADDTVPTYARVTYDDDGVENKNPDAAYFAKVFDGKAEKQTENDKDGLGE